MGGGFWKWGTLFDVGGLEARAEELMERAAAPDFWADAAEAQKVLREAKVLRGRAAAFRRVEDMYDEAQILIELAAEDGGGDLLGDLKRATADFTAAFDDLRTTILLSGEFDANDVILSLHAGAGGTEACDWVAMLARMYTRWAAARGFSVTVLDYLPGDEAGTKSTTMAISGEMAYGYLKSEKGIHRLIRLSPFDTAGKRHTSFASCDIMPEIDDEAAVEINQEDLRIDTFRSSGAGGQHVNTTDSAIRITHIPTGITVQCQNERSQHKNKDRAMKMLAAKLAEVARAEKTEMLAGVRGEVKDIGWSNQIRSYVFHPYNMVKDHRTNAEVGNINSVMDGGIDVFINAFLHWNQKN